MSSRRQDQIKHALEAIRKKNGGRLLRQHVVKAARNPKSVLHREFIWDNEKAAHLQRLDRASELIVRYISVIVVDRSIKLSAPYYVSDPQAKTNEGGYLALTDTISRPDARSIVLAELDRCKYAIERARNIAHVLNARHAGLSDELQAMLEQIIDLRSRMAAE